MLEVELNYSHRLFQNFPCETLISDQIGLSVQTLTTEDDRNLEFAKKFQVWYMSIWIKQLIYFKMNFMHANNLVLFSTVQVLK